MLRRTQSIVLKEEGEAPEEQPRPVGRRGLGGFKPDPEPAPAPEPELASWREEEALTAAQLEQRRNIDRWRAEVLQAVSQTEDDGGDNRMRRLFRPLNVVLLAVALIAGGGAAWLALSGPPAPQPEVAAVAAPAAPAEPVVVKEPMVRVLVARSTIGIGQRLNAETIEWVDWPEAAIRPEFVTATATPDALTEMDGAVARFDFLKGEPIREDKLARSAEGMLSAVLDPGTRAVAVTVSAESASGGFILPNDHVDVVLTTAGLTGQVAETILTNVRVLAINSSLGGEGAKDKPKQNPDDAAEEDSGPTTFASAVATLALDPRQSEIIIAATQSGRLSLVLRPISDVAEASVPRDVTVNQAIRMTSPFWKR